MVADIGIVLAGLALAACSGPAQAQSGTGVQPPNTDWLLQDDEMHTPNKAVTLVLKDFRVLDRDKLTAYINNPERQTPAELKRLRDEARLWQETNAKMLAKAEAASTPEKTTLLTALRMYRVAGEKQEQLKQIQRLENDEFFNKHGFWKYSMWAHHPDQQQVVDQWDSAEKDGMRYRRQEWEVEEQFRRNIQTIREDYRNGMSPSRKFIADFKRDFSSDKAFLEDAIKKLETIIKKTEDEKTVRPLELAAIPERPEVEALKAGQVSVTVRGGTPPYSVRAVNLENEVLAEGQVAREGGDFTVPLDFADAGVHSVYVYAADSAPPQARKQSDLAIEVSVREPPESQGETSQEATTPQADKGAKLPEKTSPKPAPAPANKGAAPFPRLPPGTYRGRLAMQPFWDIPVQGWFSYHGYRSRTPSAAPRYEINTWAGLWPVFDFTLDAAGHIQAEASLRVPREDYDKGDREISFSFRLEGTASFQTGRVELRVLNGKFVETAWYGSGVATTTEKFEATLVGWMVPGEHDQEITYHSSFEDDNQFRASLAQKTPGERARLLDREGLIERSDGSFAYKTWGLGGSDKPGAKAAQGRVLSHVCEDTNSKGQKMDRPVNMPSLQSHVDHAPGNWFLHVLGAGVPGPGVTTATIPPKTTEELTAFGLWPPGERSIDKLEYRLPAGETTVKFQAVGVTDALGLKYFDKEIAWRCSPGLESLGGGEFRATAPGRYRVRATMKDVRGGEWGCTWTVVAP